MLTSQLKNSVYYHIIPYLPKNTTDVSIVRDLKILNSLFF